MYEVEELTEVPVVRVKNFLPKEMIQKIYDLLEEYKQDFSIPAWSTDKNQSVSDTVKKRSLCAGKDIWFPFERDKKIIVPPTIYEYVENYLFHQGILEFMQRSDSPVFRLILNLSPDGRFHVITYGDGDYYNWHKDHSLPEGPLLYGSSPLRSNIFTFSLNLFINDDMEGGDLLFMHDNKTVKVPLAHNSLSIFPGFVYHAATEVKTANHDWIKRRISCQFWMAGPQIITRKEMQELKWAAS